MVDLVSSPDLVRSPELLTSRDRTRLVLPAGIHGRQDVKALGDGDLEANVTLQSANFPVRAVIPSMSAMDASTATKGLVFGVLHVEVEHGDGDVRGCGRGLGTSTANTDAALPITSSHASPPVSPRFSVASMGCTGGAVLEGLVLSGDGVEDVAAVGPSPDLVSSIVSAIACPSTAGDSDCAINVAVGDSEIVVGVSDIDGGGVVREEGQAPPVAMEAVRSQPADGLQQPPRLPEEPLPESLVEAALPGGVQSSCTYAHVVHTDRRAMVSLVLFLRLTAEILLPWRRQTGMPSGGDLVWWVISFKELYH
ncbi:hypothetical protein Dimus_022465 [Dionaea muscipula]